ncbi:phosphotriesterase family protein [Ottowia thiooxydans]|uniref:Phosphotriesterase-related protein n=1 Tax=Ottowia thiooxydans TaxID=219182 RepID=A0ABV2Q2Z3_9BURK
MKLGIFLSPLVAILALVACGGGSDDVNPLDFSGKAMTVNGPVNPDQLGITLPHEHIFINFAKLDHIVPVPTNINVLTETRNPNGLTYYPDALSEILRFKAAGGKTIVDTTNFGLTRDPKALKRISDESGLNVIMGAGVYMRPQHPADMGKISVEQLTQIIVDDITVGAQGTNIRSGVIGEVGLGDFSNPDVLNDNEIKSVTASARASRLTGAPINLHTFVTLRAAHEVLDMLEKEGVDLNHVVMSHVGGKFSIDELAALMDRGVYVERDFVGQAPGSSFGGASATTIADWAAALANKGDKYAKRILLAHDICIQAQLTINGGGGYAYILEEIVPLLKTRVSQGVIDDILKNNPQRAMTFTQPKKLIPRG